MDLVSIVRSNIRRFRKLRGMTQEELAEAINVSRTHVGNIEAGSNFPSMEALGRICEALKVKPYEMFYTSTRGREKKAEQIDDIVAILWKVPPKRLKEVEEIVRQVMKME